MATLLPTLPALFAGANIGMFTLFAACATKGQARIVSFEPIPSTFAVLEANSKAAAEGRYAKWCDAGAAGASKLEITPLNEGLSDKPAEVRRSACPLMLPRVCTMRWHLRVLRSHEQDLSCRILSFSRAGGLVRLMVGQPAIGF